MSSDSPITPTSQIPIEIISDEEMDLIEAAFETAAASTDSLPSSSSSTPHFVNNVRSIESITLHSKKRLATTFPTQSPNLGDIEDLWGAKKKKSRFLESYLYQFRSKRGLSVTDITASEWCEKKMEFSLLHGKPKPTQVMKAGTVRHEKLEQDGGGFTILVKKGRNGAAALLVWSLCRSTPDLYNGEEDVQRAEVKVESAEAAWALRLMNFVVGANQLLFEGLTRELPIIGFVQGVWMVGVIDEISMLLTETVGSPLLVDTKTRSRATLPSEPQKRNGRLQLMCYKYLWDNAVTNNFPANRFYEFFGLNPCYILSKEIQNLTASSGLFAKTFEDVMIFYQNACCILPPANDQLVLRYEYQGDYSLLGEEQFTYDGDWLVSQLKSHLEFLMGEREASYVPEDERWKCQYCEFASICPSNMTSETEPIKDPS